MTTTCLGCGCDDDHACRDDMSAGCHWLELDVKTGIGICSACPELRKRWRDGHRDPLTEFTELRVVQLLGKLYDVRGARSWFRSPHKQLGNKSPSSLVARGQILKVRQVIEQLRDGVFI